VSSRKGTGALAILGTAAAIVLLLGGSGLFPAFARGPALEPELATYMGGLQHHTHKLDLAIRSENAELAGFYLHEVEEISEQVEDLFPRHDGHAVAELVRTVLEPRLVELRSSLEESSWEDAGKSVSGLIEACNQCHAATGHGFIHIERTAGNPFNQSFGR
jgi:hypothetical protein